MKKIILFAVMGLLAACGNNQKKPAENASGQIEATTAQQTDAPTYKLDDLLKVAEKHVDQKIKVIGHVTHTCKHAGKRCFIVGDSQKASVRVEAKGSKIGGFNRELIGSQISITGILRENRLSREYLDQTEKDLNDKKIQLGGNAESCNAELANISSMKEWMKENGKDYYSLYYIDGEEYEVVEE